MAFKIIWTFQAREDLREIVTFISADHSAAAESFGFLLISKADLLEKFPQIGRVVPEQENEEVREIIVRPYRIIYQIFPVKGLIAILRVWHGARGEPNIPKTPEF